MPKDERLYIRTALDMPSNPKIVSAPAAAKWLDICGQIVAKRELSDGIIRPTVAVAEADVPTKHARDLVARGRWHDPGHDCPKCAQPPSGHVIIHDFLEHQQSREEVEAAKRKKSSAGKKGAEARWNGTSHGTRHSSSHGTTDGKAHGTSMAESESDANNVVSLSSQSIKQRVDEDGLTRIRETIGRACTKAHARKTADFILAKAPTDVRNPVNYVLKAIRDEPELYAFHRGNPTKDTCCTEPGHQGEWADACRSCALDRKLGSA